MTDIIVSSGVTSSNLTLSAGDTEEVLSGGSAYVSLLNVGATQTVAFGGTALYTNLSGGLENVAGLSIYTTLQDGNEGVFSVENVAAGGLASRTDVFGSSTLNVASGGFAVSSYVFGPGASDDILSGGSAQYTTAVEGGVENVFAQGSASFSIVSGGTQNVFGTTLEAVIAGTFVSPDLVPVAPGRRRGDQARDPAGVVVAERRIRRSRGEQYHLERWFRGCAERRRHDRNHCQWRGRRDNLLWRPRVLDIREL